MSKIVFICLRNRMRNDHLHNGFKILFDRLTPDNISPVPPLIMHDNGILIGIFNPSESLSIESNSVCLGNLINPEDDWWVPMAKIPDGSYALFRSDENTIELISDIVASRTIWYVQTENMFIASSSQRAIVFFLRSFEPNRTAFSWMLSSGSLGPGLSWDSRIRHLNGNSRLILHRSSWEYVIRREVTSFEPSDLSDKEHEIYLRESLDYVFSHLRLDYSRWVLALSGGFDSRAILLMLKDRQKLKCVTWGLRSSLDDRGSDAYIARSLAAYFDLKHEYYEMDMLGEPIEDIFSRFLVAGEGRTDNISGYVDGFKVWKSLFESKFWGIVRGDVGFGFVPVTNITDVRKCVGANLFSDYPNLGNADEIGLGKQVWPEDLHRKEGESLAMWRDRLYHEFCIPFGLAALNDLKCSYVEVINPLLSRRITQQVRELPDHLRNGKVLFKKIVSSMSPELAFAERRSIPSLRDILKTQRVANLISDELGSNYARALLSDEFVNFILGGIEVDSANVSTRVRESTKLLKAYTPSYIKKWAKAIMKKRVVKQQMDFNILAFRAYLTCKMNQILSDDANAFL